MYLDVTENYYTLKDDVKVFLKFISQRKIRVLLLEDFLMRFSNIPSFLRFLTCNRKRTAQSSI